MKVIKLITLAVVIGSVIFYGCKSEIYPDDVHRNNEGDGSIAGIWVMTQMTFEVGTATYTVMASDSQQLTLTLNTDMTYHQKQISISSGVNVITEEDGTYSISESDFDLISRAGIPTSGNYSLEGDTMILTSTKVSQGQTYTTVYHFIRGY